ncbi:YoaK family protein [Pseudoflavonifractor phocaeensis]|uniref:YoaK family protein n=1 Tax=Pseudoflavonifractor phocaeensis TaxID=1870988 RepID=UPI001FB045D2|nr:YoaK family protein [Pseudoflavonifractor phocaeensis]
MDTRGKQMSETFRLGAVLAVAGGFLDAYTYLVRGKVFANAETGNMVLLGVNLLNRQWFTALGYLAPILAFAAGVVAAEAIKRRCQGRLIHWRQLCVLAEAILLSGVAFLPQELNSLANIAVAFVCAVQVESFRKVHGHAFATTMCTGNLRSGTERLWQFLQSGKREDRRQAGEYYGIILFFIAGAALGGFVCVRFAERAVLLPCALLLAAFGMMFWKNETGQAKDCPRV